MTLALRENKSQSTIKNKFNKLFKQIYGIIVMKQTYVYARDCLINLQAMPQITNDTQQSKKTY